MAGRTSSSAWLPSWNRLIRGCLIIRRSPETAVVVSFGANRGRATADMAACTASRNQLGLRECPVTVADLVVRSVQPDQVVPSWCDRQAVCCNGVTAAELNGDLGVGATLGGDVVERIGISPVGSEVTVFVVDGD